MPSKSSGSKGGAILRPIQKAWLRKHSRELVLGVGSLITLWYISSSMPRLVLGARVDRTAPLTDPTRLNPPQPKPQDGEQVRPYSGAAGRGRRA